jgi:hypothetical protein
MKYMVILSILSLVLTILTNAFTIKYIGPSFNRTEHINVNDWMRKWVLFFAWYSLVVTIIMVVTIAIGGAFGSKHLFTMSMPMPNV